MPNPLLEQSLATPFGQHWNNLNPENVKEQILTGADKNGFVPTEIAKLFPVTTDTVLDFGCGIGRNREALRKFFGRVSALVGFDLPGMLNLMSLHGQAMYDRVYDDFTYVESIKPRVIYASLCFQHIPTDVLNQYLCRMSKWPHLLYVVTRRYNDGNHDEVFDIITEYYKPVWLSRDTDNLASLDNPELHWCGIFSPNLMDEPDIEMTVL